MPADTLRNAGNVLAAVVLARCAAEASGSEVAVRSDGAIEKLYDLEAQSSPTKFMNVLMPIVMLAICVGSFCIGL